MNNAFFKNLKLSQEVLQKCLQEKQCCCNSYQSMTLRSVFQGLNIFCSVSRGQLWNNSLTSASIAEMDVAVIKWPVFSKKCLPRDHLLKNVYPAKVGRYKTVRKARVSALFFFLWIWSMLFFISTTAIVCDSCMQVQYFFHFCFIFCRSISQVGLGKTIRLYETIVCCVCWCLRLAAEPAGITTLASALSAGASLTITLFQLINYPVAYLTVISEIAWAGKGWDRNVMKVRERENEHLRVV